MTTQSQIVSMTLWGEARNRSAKTSISAVASVIWLRALRLAAKDATMELPDALAAVCLAPAQFSCWSHAVGFPVFSQDPPYPCPQWMFCQEESESMVAGAFVPTIIADHYCADSCTPEWAETMPIVAEIGKQRFFLSDPSVPWAT